MRCDWRLNLISHSDSYCWSTRSLLSTEHFGILHWPSLQLFEWNFIKAKYCLQIEQDTDLVHILECSLILLIFLQEIISQALSLHSKWCSIALILLLMMEILSILSWIILFCEPNFVFYESHQCSPSKTWKPTEYYVYVVLMFLYRLVQTYKMSTQMMVKSMVKLIDYDITLAFTTRILND